MFHPILMGSPNAHVSQDWVRPKAGAWNSAQVSHVIQELGLSLLLHRACVSRKLESKWIQAIQDGVQVCQTVT